MRALDPLAVPLQGATLVEASAGTGKTFTITTLFVRLLLERELAVSEILVVTFTRAATAELRDRARRRLLEALAALDGGSGVDPALAEWLKQRARNGQRERDRKALSQALRDFDEAAIFTIHGFCQRALTEHAFESRAPFELELVEEQAPLLHELAHDFWANLAYDAEPELVPTLVERCGPKALESLVAKAVGDPTAVVIPEPPAELPLIAAEVASARDRAAAAFRRDRAAVVTLLCEQHHLSRSKYKPETVREIWLPVLDQLEAYSPAELPAWI